MSHTHTHARSWLRWLGAAVVVAPTIVAIPASSEEFALKQIEMIVPFSAGGAADGYFRYMARMLEKNLPGTPKIIIKNVTGGGSIVGANQFQAKAKTDGSTLLAVSTSTTLTHAVRPNDPSIRFDPATWQAFVTSPTNRTMFFHIGTGVTKLEDLRTFGGKQVQISLSSPTGSDMVNLLSLYLLGINAKPIFGMDGGDEKLALARGEIQANGGPLNNFQDLVDTKTIVPLFSFGYVDEKGQIQRDPYTPDLPTFPEVYKMIHGKEPSGIAFEVWKSLFYLAVANSKLVVLPQGTPKEIVDLYAAAMGKAVVSEEFAKTSERFTGVYPQVVGERAQEALSKLTITNEAREWLHNWLRTTYDVKF